MAFRRSARSGAGQHLKGIDFFDGFTDAELDRVAELAEEIDAEAGAILMEQGKPGQECFVILEGRAGVHVGENRVATVQAGSTVGEMALIDQRPRSATVTAIEPMRLLRFDTEEFRQLLEEMPKASQRVMADMNEKLRHQNLAE